jgi:DNA-binding NarL/FixJ family response regulator
VISTAAVVGRDQELAALADFFGSGERLPGVLLLEGEAGIGKTTLWRAGVELAGDRFRVLTSSPSGAETQLSYAAAGDLLDGVGPEEAVDGLPEPQRRALRVALLVEEPSSERPTEPRTVAVAFLNALRALAQGSPLLVAVDDVQWLDLASAVVLAYATRRLREEPIALLLARRLEGAGRLPLELDRMPAERQLIRVAVSPLTLGAVHRLLHTRIGMSFPRPTLRRLHAVSGGNPFYALELARALERQGGRLEPGAELPLSGDLSALLRARLAPLPHETLEALLAAAALATPTVGLLVAAGGGEVRTVLESAVDAGVIEVPDDRIRFTHPLLAAAVYAQADARRRRECHRRLAEVVADAEERARHLALAVEAPDLAVAAALEEAALGAFARGAIESAAALGEQALRFTPGAQLEALQRRRMAVAGYLARAGAKARARRLIEEAWDAAEPGPERARVAFVIAWLGLGTLEQRAAALRTALADAADDVQLLARIHAVLASLPFPVLPPEETAAHATVGFELAEKVGEPGTWVVAAMATLWIDLLRGHGLDRERLERALALESSAARFTDPIVVRFFAAFAAYANGDLARARTMLERIETEDRERGDTGVASTLALLADVELDAGHWTRAEALATESLELALDAEDGFQEADARRVLVRLAALRGDADRARRLAEEAIRVADAVAAADCRSRIRATVGMLELSLGDGFAAAALLDEAVSFAERARVGEPGLLWFVPERVEAAVAVGALDEAERMLAPFESSARQLERTAAEATALRARALIESARGDLERAVSTTEEALALHERSPQPFDCARTLLVRGSLLRRLRRRRDARETLERAVSEFEQLGAAIWSVRARDELARIGGRVPSAGELTPSERRIAELVAEGKTNREVAAILVVADRTVESALTQIYRKLDVRSRTQLARKLAGAG